MGVTAGEGLADSDGWEEEDKRFCDVGGNDFGMAGGSTGSVGIAGCEGTTPAEGPAAALGSAKTLRSDQSSRLEEAAGGGVGDGVRGGGVLAWLNSSASMLRPGEDERAGGEKGSKESVGDSVEDGKEDVRVTGGGCCS